MMCLAVALMMCGCSGENKRILYLYNWSDYINPSVVEKFETENDCKVVINTFEDNETMLAKLVMGAGGYDVIFPSSYVTPVLRRQGLIQKLDMSKLPNVVANRDEKYNRLLHEDSFVYSVPYAFSITGVAYRKDRIKESDIKKSWDDLKTPASSGRVCMLRDMREVLGMGLIMQGASINSTDDGQLNKACDYALTIKKIVQCLDNEAYKSGLVSGDFWMAMGYNSDILQIMDENENVPIDFFIPSEGTTCCWDEMVIPVDCRDRDLAYKFIDFVYRADVAAENLSYVCTAVPNKGMLALVDEESRSNPWINPTEEMLNKGELIKDVGDDIRKFQKTWDRFVTTRVRD